MGSKLLKILGAFLAIYAVFFVYSYFFGPMYGGKKYQREAFDAQAKYLLKQYRSQQRINFSETGKYDKSLQDKPPFSGAKGVVLAFTDDPFVREHCPECVMTTSTYRIAAFRKDHDPQRIWTINEKGELSSLP